MTGNPDGARNNTARRAITAGLTAILAFGQAMPMGIALAEEGPTDTAPSYGSPSNDDGGSSAGDTGGYGDSDDGSDSYGSYGSNDTDGSYGSDSSYDAYGSDDSDGQGSKGSDATGDSGSATSGDTTDNGGTTGDADKTDGTDGQGSEGSDGSEANNGDGSDTSHDDYEDYDGGYDGGYDGNADGGHTDDGGWSDIGDGGTVTNPDGTGANTNTDTKDDDQSQISQPTDREIDAAISELAGDDAGPRTARDILDAAGTLASYAMAEAEGIDEITLAAALHGEGLLELAERTGIMDDVKAAAEAAGMTVEEYAERQDALALELLGSLWGVIDDATLARQERARAHGLTLDTYDAALSGATSDALIPANLKQWVMRTAPDANAKSIIASLVSTPRLTLRRLVRLLKSERGPELMRQAMTQVGRLARSLAGDPVAQRQAAEAASEALGAAFASNSSANLVEILDRYREQVPTNDMCMNVLEELSVATGVPVSLWATGQVSSDALVREVIDADAISTQLALADAMIDDAASRRGLSRTAYLNQIDAILAAEAKDAYGLMRDAGPARDAARIAYRTRLDSPGIDAAKGLLESYLRVSGIDASQAGMDAVIKRITSDADRMTEARTELRRVVEKLEGMAQDPRITRK